jgi:hypothetical protein
MLRKLENRTYLQSIVLDPLAGPNQDVEISSPNYPDRRPPTSTDRPLSKLPIPQPSASRPAPSQTLLPAPLC